MQYNRYAVYFLPPSDVDWAQRATRWLGWDAADGVAVPHPDIPGANIAAWTKRPRKYGLHATLKPPFRLSAGETVGALADACAALARACSPARAGRLTPKRLGRFLALQPEGDLAEINTLASACVRDLDRFRAPAGPDEIARRRANRLTARQEGYLNSWGYPYVMHDFRFHITLTGPLGDAERDLAEAAVHAFLAPSLPERTKIPDIALMGEAADGRFHLLHRYTLSS